MWLRCPTRRGKRRGYTGHRHPPMHVKRSCASRTIPGVLFRWRQRGTQNAAWRAGQSLSAVQDGRDIRFLFLPKKMIRIPSFAGWARTPWLKPPRPNRSRRSSSMRFRRTWTWQSDEGRTRLLMLAKPLDCASGRACVGLDDAAALGGSRPGWAFGGGAALGADCGQWWKAALQSAMSAPTKIRNRLRAAVEMPCLSSARRCAILRRRN